MRPMTDEERLADPDAYESIFGDGHMIEVYFMGQQIFDVESVMTYSTRDRLYNPDWRNYIKLKDGTLLYGDIRLVVDGVSSTDDIALGVSVS